MNHDAFICSRCNSSASVLHEVTMGSARAKVCHHCLKEFKHDNAIDDDGGIVGFLKFSGILIGTVAVLTLAWCLIWKLITNL